VKQSISIRDKQLPETFEEFLLLQAANRITYPTCVACGRDHRDGARLFYHPADWRESQISGLCKPCFDSATKGDEHD
jgi:hypothetical protein